MMTARTHAYRVLVASLGLLAMGCTRSKATLDTAECCEHCCAPECSEGDYQWQDIYWKTEDDNSANWIHEDAPRVVEVNLDAASFAGNVQWTTGRLFTEAEVVEIFQTFLDYWNQANADITLEFDSTTKDCCNSLVDDRAVCVDCLADGENDIYFYQGDSLEILGYASGAHTQPYAPESDRYCLLEQDIVEFSGFYQNWTGEPASSSDWCNYIWEYPFVQSPEDTTCEDGDGEKEKSLKDTTVHELGHFLGLAHQPAHPDSAVNAGCVGCSYDRVGDPDMACLQELYNVCK